MKLPRPTTSVQRPPRWLAGALLTTTLLGLGGCEVLLVSGAVASGAFVATDRRTTGTQVEDQGIEIKAYNRIKDTVGDKSHVTVTSYDRQVLLTGEVFNEADKAAIEAAVTKVENVRQVVNDLEIGWPSTTSERARDSVLKAKVKATLVDARDLSANAFTVVVEHQVVYMLGKVTETEATRAIELVRNIPGVKKVVRLVQIISQEQLNDRKPK